MCTIQRAESDIVATRNTDGEQEGGGWAARAIWLCPPHRLAGRKRESMLKCSNSLCAARLPGTLLKAIRVSGPDTIHTNVGI